MNHQTKNETPQKKITKKKILVICAAASRKIDEKMSPYLS